MSERREFIYAFARKYPGYFWFTQAASFYAVMSIVDELSAAFGWTSRDPIATAFAGIFIGAASLWMARRTEPSSTEDFR